MKKIQTDLRYDNMLAIPCIHRASGLAMLWKEEITLHIQTYSQNHIDNYIMIDPNNPWRFTSFYGRPEEHYMHESQNYLKHLHTRDSLPWVCLGDFNKILNSTEKQGRFPKSHRLMEAFRSTLLHCGLIDLGYRSNIFTWRNGRPGDAFVQERLDRAYATLDWRIYLHGAMDGQGCFCSRAVGQGICYTRLERKVPIGSGEPFAGIIFRSRPNVSNPPWHYRKHKEKVNPQKV